MYKTKVYKHVPRYTFDWFSNNIDRWEEHILPLKGKELKALELGSFEGRSAVWLLENVLTHPKSHIICIDNFKASPEMKFLTKTKHSPKLPSPVTIKKHFIHNTQPYGDKVKLITSDTAVALKQTVMLKKVGTFDFIYVDAGRHSRNVLEDAVLAFPLLKIGGMIVFDDYTNSEQHDYTCPKKGIDAFLDVYSDELEVINSSWQVIAKKKAAKTKRACQSELD